MLMTYVSLCRQKFCWKREIGLFIELWWTDFFSYYEIHSQNIEIIHRKCTYKNNKILIIYFHLRKFDKTFTYTICISIRIKYIFISNFDVFVSKAHLFSFHVPYPWFCKFSRIIANGGISMENVFQNRPKCPRDLCTCLFTIASLAFRIRIDWFECLARCFNTTNFK